MKRVVWAHLGVAGVAFAFAWAITKLAIHLIGANTPNAARTTLVHDFGAKLRWFLGWRSTHESGLSFHDPLYGSLSLFELTPSRWLSGLVAIVAIVGILALLLRERLSIPLYGGIALLLVPLSFLPSLVVAENSPTYRVQAALTALIALYFVVGAYGLWVVVRDWLRPRLSRQELIGVGFLATGAAVAFVAASAFSATRNVTCLRRRCAPEGTARLRTDGQRPRHDQLHQCRRVRGSLLGEGVGPASICTSYPPRARKVVGRPTGTRRRHPAADRVDVPEERASHRRPRTAGPPLR